MEDGHALLRAILLSPADDAPRLIYADWLDEHGQPDRAALIRHMVRNEGASAYSLPTTFGYTNDLTPLVTPAVREWLAGLAADLRVARCDLEGGLVAHVELPLATFRATAASLFAAHPVTWVGLSDRRPALVPGGQWYWFFEADSPHGPHDLPTELCPDGIEYFDVYRTEEQAQAAVSAWCVKYGRRLAGLSAL